MNIDEARQMVVDAGKKLVESGLIARTWGNVSCRISPTQFVITPSGRPYETLTPEETVVVNIKDCSFEGNLEPSSEKGVHAEVYKQRGDIDFVIHTHQFYASAVSPLKTDVYIHAPAAAELIGERAVAIPYGLPGSKTLRKNVARALTNSDVRAYLMAYHGALCLGRNYSEAFEIASALEKACSDFIDRRLLEISGRENAGPESLREYFLKKQIGPGKTGLETAARPFFNSEKNDRRLKLYPEATENSPFPRNSANYLELPLDRGRPGTGSGETVPEAEIHRELYRRYEEMGAIIHTVSPDVLTVSGAGKTLFPLLDDFALIIGPNVKVANTDKPASLPGNIAGKIKGRSAVLLKNNGALCCGPTAGDARAAVMIMEKNCKALITTALFGGVKPLNPLECRLMRHVYLTRYSKKAGSK